jgi:lipopolysaccharide cholinephosphotransferase
MYALSTRKIEKKKGVLWSIGRNALVIPFKLIGFDAFIKKYDRYCKKYFTNKTSHVGITMFGEGNWDKERILVENLSGRTKLKFEDERYYVPDNYHQYLTQLYGEYMQLPPVDQRVTKHCFKAYWGIGDKEYGK